MTAGLAAPPDRPRSVRVQLVLWHHEPAAVLRTVDAVAAAVRVARRDASLAAAELAVGDSSEAPVLDERAAEELATRAGDAGFDDATFRHFGANLGSAGGSNRLADGARTDALLVLNPDTFAAPTMLAALLRALDEPAVAAADARQIPFEHPKAADPTTGDCSWVSGACMLVRRPAFEAVGGFDTDHFFLHCDDVDLSWRLRLAGHRVVHAPRAVVFHDKRLDAAGRVEAPAAEEYHGLLGRLTLAHRWARPDVAAGTEAHVEEAGTPEQRRALREFRSRVEAKGPPPRVAGAERVATFVGGEYAPHRW